jgi:hypothetical protein
VARSLPRPAAPTVGAVFEHVLPLSGCRLRVTDLPDGSRRGELFGWAGQWLDEARCEAESKVSGWFGRTGPAGTSWALAFGAGGSHQVLQVRFASSRLRRIVPVVSDQFGLWIAEVAGSFRAVTILGPSAASTLRLRYAALA